MAECVAKKRLGTDGCVEAADVAIKRTKTDCRVVVAGLDVGAKECKIPLSRVAAGIASVRCRFNGPRCGRQPEADQRNEK
jgi:hypothetical protein